MVAVAGPRIDPASLPQIDGVEVHAYVDGLYRHLAAADVAVVQGGLTTCMELTASRRPFLYFPLRGHFEQQRHVDHRLRATARGGGWTSSGPIRRPSPWRSPRRPPGTSTTARWRPTAPPGPQS